MKTNNLTIEQRIANELDWIEIKIEDAKKDIAKIADRMMQRAKEAVDQSEKLLKDDPCTLAWVEFAASDARKAAEAHAELTSLYNQRSMLLHLK